MQTDDYVEIQQLAISKAEAKSMRDPIETFYAGLISMREAINERLECAGADGVKLSEL